MRRWRRATASSASEVPSPMSCSTPEGGTAERSRPTSLVLAAPLILEDDPSIARLVQLELEYHNFAVRCAYDGPSGLDRKSTRLNSSHANISYAVFCLKKTKNKLA